MKTLRPLKIIGAFRVRNKKSSQGKTFVNKKSNADPPIIIKFKLLYEFKRGGQWCSNIIVLIVLVKQRRTKFNLIFENRTLGKSKKNKNIGLLCDELPCKAVSRHIRNLNFLENLYIFCV